MTYTFDNYGVSTDNHIILHNENVYEVYRKGEEETGYPEDCFETLDEALRYINNLEEEENTVKPDPTNMNTKKSKNYIKAMEYQKLAEVFQAIENSKDPVNMSIQEFMDYFYILYDKLFDSDIAATAGRDDIYNKIYDLEFSISIGKATYKHAWSPATVDGLDKWFKEWGDELKEEEV